MIKFIFKYGGKDHINSLPQKISSIFNTPVDKIKIQHAWPKPAVNKEEIISLSNNELMVYAICKLKNIPSISIVEFDNSPSSDSQFLNNFQDSYLCSLTGNPPKESLVELAVLLKENHYLNYLEDTLKIEFPALESRFQEAGLNSDEYKEFTDLFNNSITPMSVWSKSKASTKIKANKDKINSLNKFFVQGF